MFSRLNRKASRSFGKTAAYWTAANGMDSMYSFWNPTGSPEDFVVTLHYGDGLGQYTLPVHLAAQASTMIDVAMLKAGQTPDATGNPIPEMEEEGSIAISNPKGNAAWMTVVASGAFYNPHKGTCNCQCVYCVGYSGPDVAVDPFTVGVRGTNQLHAQATYGNGGQDDFTTSSSWSSNNRPVMTVGSSTGLVSGVSAGSGVITAFMPALVDYTGLYCPMGPCPTTNYEPQASGTAPQPVPVNFVQVGQGQQQPDGSLEFSYTWQSSSGNLQDLSLCSVFEYVNYPGTSSPYVWPSPPWYQTSSTNPTDVGVSGTDGKFNDDQLPTWGGWLKPYVTASFTATQKFQYVCNGGSVVTLMGPLSIVRTVAKNSNGSFYYKVTKNGSSATINPLP